MWRTSSGATRQGLAENAGYRFKALVGVKLASWKIEDQQVEAPVKWRIIKRTTELGMPRAERIPVV